MKTSMHAMAIFLVLMLLSLVGCGSGGSDVVPAGDSESDLGSAPVNLTIAFPNLSFSQPVALLQHPLDDQRWYVVEQSGRVRTFVEGDLSSNDFIDISSQAASGSEAGLLGMAFHPQFSNNGEVFLSYTGPGSPLVSHISRVISPDDGQTAPIASEAVVLSVAQPFLNHNGGWIAFGLDGYLYIGLGDGGSGGDPDGNGQDTTTLLGAMLRIDVDNNDPLRGTSYAIPPDNPFGASLDCTTGCPEIFAWGFRNPWRWSFDSLTAALWVGDVGQANREEIDRVTVGNNFGWNVMEGTACFPPGSLCSSADLSLPVADYGRSEGNSVTGGYVYRGSRLPALIGAYIYGDFGSGNIWQLAPDGQGGYVNSLLLRSGLNIAAFGQSRDGEIYVVSYGDGRIYSLSQAGGDG